MIVRYDKFESLDKPIFTLCNPGSIYMNGVLTNVVGMLSDTEAEEFIFNFNATSELNLRVNKISRGVGATENESFNHLANRRLLFVDDVGYFVITGVSDGFSDGVEYKDISAKTVDIELAQKMIPYIEDGTYRFRGDTVGETIGLMDILSASLPMWTVGHVDREVTERWRTFEDVDHTTNCLAFMLQNMQDAYECIFLFDIVTRTINVYDQASYLHRTDIHLTKDDLIDHIEIAENADDMYTAIAVFGDNDITVSAINPLGTTTIYDFSYYYDWMSPGLRDKVKSWQDAIEEKSSEYYDINLEYYQQMTDASDLTMELQRIETQIKMYERCRDNIVAGSGEYVINSYNDAIESSGGRRIDIKEEINDTLSQIDSLIAECRGKMDETNVALASIKDSMDAKLADIRAINESLSVTTYFSEDESSELSCYVFEGNYSDEYVTITDSMTHAERFAQMKTMFDRAKKQLSKVSRPTQEFNVDPKSFLFTEKFQHWSQQLATGCLINVELDIDDIAELFLSNITVNYQDQSVGMTFGNRYNKFDHKSLFDNMLGKISKSSNTLDMVKNTLYPLKNGELDRIGETLRDSRNLTMDEALSSANEEVVIDASGYTGRRIIADDTYDPRQVKLVSNRLVFTDDDWETCRVAIGEIVIGDGSVYGVNAEALLGQVIIGEKMMVRNEESTLTFDGSGLNVSGSKNTVTIDPNSTEIISISKGTEKLMYLDGAGDLHVSGNITATSGTIGGCVIDGNGNLKIKNANIAEKITASNINADGINASNVTISGNITATEGTIGGCNIVNGKLRIPAANIDDLVVDDVTASSIVVKDSSGRTLLSAQNNAVQIGGWKVDSNSLYTKWDDASDRIFISTGTNSNYTIGGYSQKWYIGAGSSTGSGFGISTSGKLYASGATISGSVTASSGQIGDWEISGGKLTGNDNAGHAISISPVGVTGYVNIGTQSNPSYSQMTFSWTQILTAINNVK